MTIKEIDAILEEGNSLKTIAQSYSEIANLKIKKIRSQVERNRVFFQEISAVFALIKKLAIKRQIQVVKPKKTVSLILTSNYRFYGSINSDLIDFFITATQKMDTDRIIIGKAAIDYFKAVKTSNFQQVLLKTDQPDTTELLNLVNMIKDYNQVLVFYSSMKSLLIQQPTVSDITATSASEVAVSQDKLSRQKEDFRFIFEPDLSKILQFFDSQIINLLLEGAFLESELSRTASRFISMDKAENEANKFIKDYEKLKAYAKRNMVNNTILENFASIGLKQKNN